MKEAGKGCLFFVISGLLLLLGLKLILGESFDVLLIPITIFSPIIILIIVGGGVSLGQEAIKTGKWVGLGAIFGNVANNKINADASPKKFLKKNIKTGNSTLDNFVEFVSPTPSNEDTDKNNHDLEEFQEFLLWKKEKELSKIDENKE